MVLFTVPAFRPTHGLRPGRPLQKGHLHVTLLFSRAPRPPVPIWDGMGVESIRQMEFFNGKPLRKCLVLDVALEKSVQVFPAVLPADSPGHQATVRHHIHGRGWGGGLRPDRAPEAGPEAAHIDGGSLPLPHLIPAALSQPTLEGNR